ncbi:sugar transferase [Spirosoma sp. KUDC1026]|uniref:sugar transferase n=1 Tax=Spirosoma sp. KUDC1026 TaxID=2745947 RepID=UPI00159B945A|nr:sugar transferase [Spirosoma sp. KUDC1026]QKZ11391.1 sugar transferase [Spirosoma sp. KUDC1026]
MVTFTDFNPVPITQQGSGKPVFEVSNNVTQPITNRVMKRIFDVLVASFITVAILIWLIPLLGFLIRMSSPGPIIFMQTRTGRNGKPFLCFKFRTMKYEKGAVFSQAKLKDSRVTKIGEFLRRTNLDEMPQFVNVLLGDMSLVGPRPHPLLLDEQYWNEIDGYSHRYYVRPGITGLAQVRGARGETSKAHQMQHRVRYDQLYIRRQSPWLDIKICWWTIKSMLTGKTKGW